MGLGWVGKVLGGLMMAVLEMERGRTDIRLCHRKPNSNLKYLNISEGKEKRNMIGEERDI